MRYELLFLIVPSRSVHWPPLGHGKFPILSLLGWFGFLHDAPSLNAALTTSSSHFPYFSSLLVLYDRNPRRLQNMILAVGPGTPASVCWRSSGDSDDDEDASSSSSSSEDNVLQFNVNDNNDDSSDDAVDSVEYRRLAEAAAEMETQDNNDSMDDDDDEDDDIELQQESSQEEEKEEDEDEQQEEGRGFTSRFRLRRRRRSSNIAGAARFLARRLELRRRLLLEDENNQDSDDDDMEDHRAVVTSHHNVRSRHYHPSIRHGGCINTAAWLDCPWRLSTVNEQQGRIMASSSSSFEVVADARCADYPTQLVTSGDDRVLKFWDVRDAMGGSSPLPGGYDTLCPFFNPHKTRHDRNQWNR